jgi:methyl halide transferase
MEYRKATLDSRIVQKGDQDMDINTPAFWEEIYRGGRAGWDLGGPTPALRRLAASGEFAPGRMIVLCAGRGHDAREFARHGFQVTAVEFAQDPVRDMQVRADPQALVEIVKTDMFTLPHTLDGAFDYVLEYTCFCAISPARRPDYVELVTRLLRPGGIYIDLAVPIDDHAGGPPFAVAVPDIVERFVAHGFQLQRREVPVDSVPQRRGQEELLVFRKGRMDSALRYFEE